MNREDSQSELVITFSRVKDVFAERWKIFITCVLISVFIAAFTTVYNFMYSTGTGSKKLYYQATARVYIDWDENISDAFTDLEANATNDQSWQAFVESYQNYVSIYIEQWQKTRINAIISDCTSYLSSNTVYNQLNEALLNAGYEARNGCDEITMTSTGTSHLFTVTVTGYEDQDRVQFMADNVVNILVNEGQEKLGLSNPSIIDNPSVYEVYKTTKNNAVTYVRALDYPDASQTTTVPRNTTLSLIFSSQNFIIIFAGIFVGLVIIAIYVITDKKIRDIAEVAALSDIEFLGKLSDGPSYAMLGAAISGKCTSVNVSDLKLVSLQSVDSPKKLSYLGKCMTNQNINIDLINGLSESEQNVASLSEAGAIILMIRYGQDTVSDLQEFVSCTKLIDANILGYVLCK